MENITFTYLDNKQQGVVVFIIQAPDITQADASFKLATGLDPAKTMWIGVTLDFPNKG